VQGHGGRVYKVVMCGPAGHRHGGNVCRVSLCSGKAVGRHGRQVFTGCGCACAQASGPCGRVVWVFLWALPLSPACAMLGSSVKSSPSLCVHTLCDHLLSQLLAKYIDQDRINKQAQHMRTI
jgi:hypothetical protein